MPDPFAPVAEAFQRYLPRFDLQVPEAILTTRLACYQDSDPVWLMLVAPASHGKGTALDPLKEVDNAVFISKVTPQTFLSGAETRDGRDPSLLNSIGENPLIVIKEFGNLMAGDPQIRSAVFADMREIHDGHISKSFGTGVTRRWSGKACFIVGYTHAIDMQDGFDVLLGERFLKLRYRDIEDLVALALAALNSTGQEERRREAIGEAYTHALAEGLDAYPNVQLSPEAGVQIANLAAAISRVRTPVLRNPWRKDRNEFQPKAESPARLSKALAVFGRANAALHGWEGIRDFSLIYRIALDSIAEPRRSIFIEVVRTELENGYATMKDVTGIVGETKTREVLHDLELCKVLDVEDGPTDGRGRPPKHYSLTDDIRGFLEASGVLNDNSLFFSWNRGRVGEREENVDIPPHPGFARKTNSTLWTMEKTA